MKTMEWTKTTSTTIKNPQSAHWLRRPPPFVGTKRSVGPTGGRDVEAGAGDSCVLVEGDVQSGGGEEDRGAAGEEVLELRRPHLEEGMSGGPRRSGGRERGRFTGHN